MMPTPNRGKRSARATILPASWTAFLGRVLRPPYTLLLLLSTSIGFVNAADYYVSPQGNDNAPGSEVKPWKSIQHAADTLIAGDTVFIREGSYNERVLPKNSGKPGAYITYTSYPGERATIDGAGIAYDWAGLFHINGTSYIKISELNFTNSAYFGIEIRGDVQHITIEKNHFHKCHSSAVHAWFNKARWTISDIVIDGNEITETNMSGSQEAISLCGVNGFEIMNNHVHHIHKEGIDAKEGSSNGKIHHNHVHDFYTKFAVGIYIDSSRSEGKNIEIYQNTIHDAKSGISLATELGGSLTNIKIYNNLIYGNRHGFSIHHYEKPGTHLKKDISLINNTFHNNELAVRMTEVKENFANLIIRNNIFSGKGRAATNLGSLKEEDLTMDHNLFGPASKIHTFGKNTLKGDPQFINAAKADFRLQKDSPAIDRGSAEKAPSSDFDGNTRPRGKAYDIGAYEMP